MLPGWLMLRPLAHFIRQSHYIWLNGRLTGLAVAAPLLLMVGNVITAVIRAWPPSHNAHFRRGMGLLPTYPFNVRVRRAPDNTPVPERADFGLPFPVRYHKDG